MTVEEYFLLDEQDVNARYEYIDGQIRMLAGGTPNHSQIGANFVAMLYFALEGKGCRVFNSDVYLRLSESQYFHPDVLVSCDQRDRYQKKVIQHPRIVVEVLSPGTESYDRRQKFICYQAFSSLQEYLLVDAEQQWIELFRRESNNLWSYHVFGPEDEIELMSIEAHFPMSSVYRDVDF
jgi:Uma2 family endonuclease